jgi:hypothetical protein
MGETMNKTDHALAEQVDRFFKTRYSPMTRSAALCHKDLSIDEEARTVDGVLSTEEVDRDGDVVLTRGLNLDRFRANPVVLFMHDPHAPIGKCNDGPKVRRRKGINQLVGRTQFAETPLACEIFGLVMGEFLKGQSIAMLPSTMKLRAPKPDELRKAHFKGARTVIEYGEVIEYSIVSVPANAESLTTAMTKGLVRETETFFEPFIKAVTDASPRKKPFVRVVEVPAPVAKVTQLPPWGRIRERPVTAKELERRLHHAAAYEAGRI